MKRLIYTKITPETLLFEADSSSDKVKFFLQVEDLVIYFKKHKGSTFLTTNMKEEMDEAEEGEKKLIPTKNMYYSIGKISHLDASRHLFNQIRENHAFSGIIKIYSSKMILVGMCFAIKNYAPIQKKIDRILEKQDMVSLNLNSTETDPIETYDQGIQLDISLDCVVRKIEETQHENGVA